MHEPDLTVTADDLAPTVRAVNELTARWCSQFDDDDRVVSGAGVWPLLVLIASAADESARVELAAALGCPADSAREDAFALLDTLRAGSSTSTAVGAWTHGDVPLNPDWVSRLPAGVVEKLTGQDALDKWATNGTGGLIDRFPLDIDDDTRLILASVVAAKTQWRDPFEWSSRGCDPFAGDAEPKWLDRYTDDPSVVAVLDDSVTRVVVEGTDDLDVHLLLGDQTPGDVLTTGLSELSGGTRVQPAIEFTGRAPGLTVRTIESDKPGDRLKLELPAFSIDSHHDLLSHRDLFGLHAVTDPENSHLPHLSPAPLFVAKGAQDVIARFSPEGFETAAATAFALTPTGAFPLDKHQIKLVSVSFDRPFGFLAVHRPTRLAVVAGWVSSPFNRPG